MREKLKEKQGQFSLSWLTRESAKRAISPASSSRAEKAVRSLWEMEKNSDCKNEILSASRASEYSEKENGAVSERHMISTLPQEKRFFILTAEVHFIVYPAV